MQPVKRQPQVIHEDNHLIVINKPPLLATMGAARGEPSLVDWARQWIKRKYDKPGNVYLGVVSRLDAFTCGLIVFARTSKAAARLTKQFQSGQVSKTYTAILEGELSATEGRLVDWIVKNDAQKRMVVCDQNHPQARRAELEFRQIGQFKQLSCIRVNLLTGRKHQIRVQFASRGTPVLGDRKYGGSAEFAPGIALQSSTLAFQHPVRREEMSFTIEPPKHWKMGRFS